MNKAKFNPDWIPPPGATVEDLLSRGNARSSRRTIVDHLGAERTGMFFEGHLEIDSKLASFLADAVGLSASFWLERETIYRADLVQRQAEKQLLGQLPLDEMRARAFIQPVHSHAETVAEVVRFFGKDDPESCRETIEQLPTLVRQKTSRSITSNPGALAVWIRAGEIEAARAECANWNPHLLRELLPEFRKLTRIEDPRKYLPKLKNLCQTCGIAFVVLRAPSGCRARGAVRLLSATKIMLLLSYRHLSDDQFWFTFFHELGHLLGNPQDTVDDDDNESETADEIEADRYASDILIPPELQRELNSLRDSRSIIAFARRVGVSRGVVVGQMQHKRLIGFNEFSSLKVYYQWTANNEIEKKPSRT